MTSKEKEFEDTSRTIMLKRSFRDALGIACEVYNLDSEARRELGDMYWVTALNTLTALPIEDRMFTALHTFLTHLRNGKIRERVTNPRKNVVPTWVV